MNYLKRYKVAFILTTLLLAFLIQISYYCRIYEHVGTEPTRDFDLVLTYSDASSMDAALQMAHSHHKPLYVSQAAWEVLPFRGKPVSELAQVHMDQTSSTTDQNARHAAPYIKQMGYKRVLLDVAWFHVPRALFLTRLYLLGSGVKVIPCMKTPPPENWWSHPMFRRELFKFWGSLGRVILAFFGWETGPSHGTRPS
jgi:hypothetical protein